MKDKVELDITYPHAADEVWKAITDPASLRDWLMPTDFKPLIGFRFRFDRPGGEPVKGKVIDVEDGRLLAYTWDDGESPEPSVVCWTLDPVEGGTRVRLEHRYVETPVVNCIPMPWYFNWRYALRHSLPGLLALLAGGQASPPIFYFSEKLGDLRPHGSTATSPAGGIRLRIGFRQQAGVR